VLAPRRDSGIIPGDSPAKAFPVTDVLDRLRSALGERYDIERQVGEGGMATVYRAKDVKHERTVAIKVLRQELSVSLGADRFLREIRVAANLQHPNILGLYDSGEAAGLLYYVMPFVEGESLRDRLNKEQQLPIQDALQIVREAAEALQYAHERGIVHRDIKPENILLLGGHALVADFGIARAVSSASEEKLTQTGMAVGTPHYMSPEQSLGSEHVDARSDVYSLGCVLYEILIGQPPFTGPNSMAIMARHSMEVVPSLQVVRSSISDEIEDVVLQALEKTPADRFQTMKELAERLGDAEAEAAMARTAQRRASSGARRVSGQVSGGQRRRTGSREVKVERRTPAELAAAVIREGGIKLWSVAAGGLVLLGGLGVGTWKLTHHRGEPAAAAVAGDSSLEPTHIAVLYFNTEGGSDSLNYLADGLTESLIHELSAVDGLQVISSNGVRPFKNGTTPLSRVASELKVGTLVHGEMRQSGDRVRVTVALANAATGVEIGSKTIEGKAGDVFALQDDLSKQVAFFLRKQLGPEVEVREMRATTTSADAWKLYQRAEAESRDADALAAAGDTVGARHKSERTDSLLALAAQKDPKWAEPVTLRGWLRFRASRMFPSAAPTYHATVIAKGLELAQQALALKADDPDALELRGTLRYWKWLNNLGGTPAQADALHDEAEKDLRAAVDLNPKQASAWTTLSHLLLGKPATGEAKLAAMRAYDADPYLSNANVTVYRLFVTSYVLDDALEARKWCDEGQRRFPTDYRFAECRLFYSNMKAAIPDVPEDWAALDSLVKFSPPGMKPINKLKGQMRVGIALARASRADSAKPAEARLLADSARRVMERSRGDATIDTGRELPQLETIGRWILGDKDEAFKQFSVYLASNPQVLENLEQDDSWEMKDMLADPRFAATFLSKH
jgi:TolB-like protein/tRNA A-37 threonylcarbamoyl transferase component Bud32